MVTIKAKKSYAGKKKPEQEIMTIAQNVKSMVEKKRKTLTIIGSAAAVLLVLFGGLSMKRSIDEQSAGPLLAAAYEQYGRTMAPAPDYAKALELFRNVQNKYPSTTSGKIAGYYAANCLMSLGRNEDALKEYQAFIAKNRNDQFMLGLVYTRMGYLYNLMGKQGDAIKAFEQADSLSGPGIATLELAKIYETSGNSADAQKKYKMIADGLAGTSLAAEAMGKVQQTAPISGASAKESTGKPGSK